MVQILAMWMPGPFEIVVIAFVGLLLFGRRLPEVGRSLGRSIVEFKKGVREAKDEIDVADSIEAQRKRALPPIQTGTSRMAGSAEPSKTGVETGEDVVSERR